MINSYILDSKEQMYYKNIAFFLAKTTRIVLIKIEINHITKEGQDFLPKYIQLEPGV